VVGTVVGTVVGIYRIILLNACCANVPSTCEMYDDEYFNLLPINFE
jgi:hypothetical protein